MASLVVRAACAAIVILTAASCKGGGGTGPTPPDSSGGPATSISICGSVSTPSDPCLPVPKNAIELRASGGNGVTCPCFNFTAVNQKFEDENTAQRNFGVTGFTAGTYVVTGQFFNGQFGITFGHNPTFSAIAVVPSSMKSLSGPQPNLSNQCGIFYSPPFNGQPPFDFSFEFTVANKSDGGSC